MIDWISSLSPYFKFSPIFTYSICLLWIKWNLLATISRRSLKNLWFLLSVCMRMFGCQPETCILYDSRALACHYSASGFDLWPLWPVYTQSAHLCLSPLDTLEDSEDCHQAAQSLSLLFFLSLFLLLPLLGCKTPKQLVSGGPSIDLAGLSMQGDWAKLH